MSSLSLDLAIWLRERRPGLLVSDVAATNETIEVLSCVLGCLLATVKARCGEEAYRDAMRQLPLQIDEMAQRTYIAARQRKAGPREEGTIQ